MVELFKKNRNSLNGVEPSITSKELKELQRLLADLPTLGPNDKFAGRKIEVPRDLARYWQYSRAAPNGYAFWNLGKVETLRFVELCNSYGADEHGSGLRLRDRMVPLAEWQSDDKAEMQAMLEKAARRNESPVIKW